MRLSTQRFLQKSSSVSRLIGFILLICLLTVSFLESGQLIVLKVRIQTANVRSEPDLGSAIIKQLRLGDLLEANSRLGDWYEIVVTDRSGNIASAYIHSSSVEVVSAPKAIEPEARPVISPQQIPTDLPQREAESPPYSAVASKHMTGFFLKFGVIDKGWGDWLGSVGYDLRVYKNFTLGLEVMPSYYAVEDEINQLKLTSIPVNVFLNIKAGTGLGRIKPEMDFIKLFGGLGGGIYADRSESTFEQVNSNLFTTYGALHLLGGFELQAGKVDLIFEYQLIRILDPVSSKDPWIGYLIFGIRL